MRRGALYMGCSFKCILKVGVEKLIVNAPLVSLHSKNTNNAICAWILNGNYEKMLEIWERSILKRIYRDKKVDDQRRRRTKDEIATLFGEHKITEEMRTQRLRWLENVKRLPENRFTKQAIYRRKHEGKKKRGRQNKKWIQEVEEDSVEKGGKTRASMASSKINKNKKNHFGRNLVFYRIH
jgi:hypothetical protein